MPTKINLSQTASVRHIALGDQSTAAAYLANLYIPIFDTGKGEVKKRYEVANQIAGLHFKEDNNSLLYGVDDSFGLHLFDIRTDSKKKIRMNPEVENHLVTCSAISKNYVAVASSTFGCGIADVRVSRKKENHPNVLTLFDLRRPSEPITTYARKHASEIVSLEFYKNGTDIITGGKDGVVRSFNCERMDEDNALRWTQYINGGVTKVGVINKRISFAVGDQKDCNVFIDTKNELEVLFGSAQKNPGPEIKPSPAFFPDSEYVVSLLKGVSDDVPIIAVWGKKGSDKLRLTGLDQQGNRQTKSLGDYHAHEGAVKCLASDKNRLLTGGEDGCVVIKSLDFRKEGGGKVKTDKGNIDKKDRGDEDVNPSKAEKSDNKKADRKSKPY